MKINICANRRRKMGQSTSANTISYIPASSRRRSFLSPFSRRKKQKSPLSATFQAPCSSNFEALNINTATVEQFMTLPGIDRRVAQSIVDHRVAIGGRFQRTDDLALVSGIGAERLEQIRPEICIKRSTRSNQGSSMSSRTPSLDSLFSDPNLGQPQKLILNVNTSSVFQLQQINGMNQEIAANLVDYRNRKGPFKSLDELIKVKGLSQMRLGALRSSLCVNNDEIPKTPKFSHASSVTNGPTTTPVKSGFNSGHRKSLSVPIKMNLGMTNGFANVPVDDIFDLLGAYSHRPIVEDSYNYIRNGHNTLRIASWNLDKFTFEKSDNPGVKEVICRTILENKWSIVCVQEVMEPSALHNICKELNQPSLRRVIEWKDNTKNWKYIANSTCIDSNDINGLGFIYNADRCDLEQDECFEISLANCADVQDCPVQPSAFIAAFGMDDWTCYILNTYLRFFDLRQIDTIIKSVESSLETQKISISDIFFVAGDFSSTTYDPDPIKHFKATDKPGSREPVNIDLDDIGFYRVVDSYSTSFSRDLPLNKLDIISSCNILCRDKMPVRNAFRKALYKTKSPLSIQNLNQVPSGKSDKLCGYYGVVRQGMCHMAIPRGWTWGGPVSEHCPVWVEVYKRKNRIASTLHQSLDNDKEDEHSSVNQQIVRRNSFNSNMSYKRLNGHGNVNGLNESSDSVFEK